MNKNRKVAGVIIVANKLLLVRKKNTSIFISPGGKTEGNETDFEALARELYEEVGLFLKSAELLCISTRKSALEDANIEISVYVADCIGYPEPRSEIVECLWVDETILKSDIEIRSVFKEDVIPLLISNGLLHSPKFEDAAPPVFVFDIDGTIFHNVYDLDKDIENKVFELMQAGFPTVIATSRSLRGIRSYSERLFEACHIVSNNGALLFDRRENKRIANCIPEEVCAKIFDLLVCAKASFYLERGESFWIYGDHLKFPHLVSSAHGAYSQELETCDETRVSRENILKFEVAGGLPETFLESLGVSAASVNIVFQSGGFSIMASKVTKLWGIQQLTSIQGAKIISFGNDLNDFEMLSSSASGYVVGSLLEELTKTSNRLMRIEAQSVSPIIQEYIAINGKHS